MPLASTSLLVQFALVLAAALWAVFPTREEYAELAGNDAPNAYSVAYLRVLTRADPRDVQLRLLYARHLATLGNWADALQELEPVRKDRAVGDQANELRFDVLLAQARTLPVGSPERKAAFHDVVTELEALVDGGGRPDRMAKNALLALGLEEPRLAARFYAGAAAADPARRLEYTRLSGKWYLAAGDLADAAVAYQRAVDLDATGAEAQDDAARAVDVLEEGERTADACDLALTYLDRWDEPRWLDRAIALATAAGRVTGARDLGRRRLARAPDDPALLEAQVHRELWAGDPRAAWPLVRRIRELRPDDAALRELEARLAEWSGHPAEALEDWLWLLARGHDVKAPLP